MKPIRRLQRTNKNQYLLTIPKTLVAVLGLRPQQAVTFSLVKDAVQVRKGTQLPSRRVQCTNKDQYTLTMPKTLIDVLMWRGKDSIGFSLDKESLCIRKVSP